MAAGVLGSASAAEESLLSPINHLVTALGDGDSQGAMECFDPSCPEFDTLSEDITALTGSFQISVHADVVEEGPSALTLDWLLNLRSTSADQTFTRREQVKTTFVKREGHWSIASFSPIALFDPQTPAS
jgi:hypothetical protein